MKSFLNRRDFIGTSSLAGAGLALSSFTPSVTLAVDSEKPALLGGKPICSERFPAWPIFDETEEKALLETLRSRQWYRGFGKAVARFEEAYQRLTGAKHC